MKLILVMGPTGVGKTGFAIRLAERVGGEIINADSVQLYRGFDIGSAKPGQQELARVRHHLVDVLDPEEDFDAARFARLAAKATKDITQRGFAPIVAGGTFLYVRALVKGLFPGPPRDDAVRERLKAEAEAEGRAALHARLEEVDPESARRIHPNDLVRTVRALEVLELTGTRLSEHTAGHGFRGGAFSTLGFCLHIGREELYERVDARVDEMIAAGFVEEVVGLLASGVSLGCKPMNSLGYKHLARHLAGELSLDDAVRLMKRDTRRFAKRQLTWLRKEAGLIRLHPDEHERAASLAQDFLFRGAG